MDTLILMIIGATIFVALVLFIPAFANAMTSLALTIFVATFIVAFRGVLLFAAWCLVDLAFPEMMPEPDLVKSVLLAAALLIVSSTLSSPFTNKSLTRGTETKKNPAS